MPTPRITIAASAQVTTSHSYLLFRFISSAPLGPGAGGPGDDGAPIIRPERKRVTRHGFGLSVTLPHLSTATARWVLGVLRAVAAVAVAVVKTWPQHWQNSELPVKPKRNARSK